MTIENLNCTPSTIYPLIEKCVGVGLVPFIQSSPGIGKSSLVRQLAEEHDLELIDVRLSMAAPEDLNGLPRFINNKAEFVPFSMFPLKGEPKPEGKKGWILFLDEFNSAPRSIQAAAYKLVLDRMVGMHTLHEDVAIICAGNLSSDGAITHNLSTALQSRLVHLTMDVSNEDWLKNVAIPNDYDERIIAFINYSPDSLMKFDAEKQMESSHSFSCPRTWEFVNKIIKDEKNLMPLLPLIRGSIDAHDAISFIQFVEVYAHIPTIDQVCSNKPPAIPKDAPTQWATAIHLAKHTTEKNIKKIDDWLQHLPMPIQIVYLVFIRQANPILLAHPVVTDINMRLAKRL